MKLSPSSRLVLIALRKSEHRLKTSEIRHATGLDAGQIIGATIDLEELGLVDVEHENQKWYYSVTQAGREFPL